MTESFTITTTTYLYKRDRANFPCIQHTKTFFFYLIVKVMAVMAQLIFLASVIG